MFPDRREAAILRTLYGQPSQTPNDKLSSGGRAEP